MYPNRSEYSHRRHYSDRSSRYEYDEWREERHEPHREAPRDVYHTYGGVDGRGSAESTSRSREYSNSPQRSYGKDSSNRDWSRKSPVRRRMSSPVWDSSDKKMRRFVEDDDEGDYKYRCEPQEKHYRHSVDGYSRSHGTKDFKDAPSKEDDFKYRKTPQDSRHRQQEFTYRQRYDDPPYRRASGGYKDRERSRDRSQERAGSQDRSMKQFPKPRERTDGLPTSTYQEEYQQPGGTRFPLNESCAQSLHSDVMLQSDVTPQSAAVPDQKSAKGFQRFLDLLNKGVNVDMLTKIVTQTSAEDADQPNSPPTFMNAADRPWSPGHAAAAGEQQGKHHGNSSWSESEQPHGRVSPQPRHRSLSPKQRRPSVDTSAQRSSREQSYFNSNSRSPSVVAEKMTPEDEHKHRHMQDVLQAIGLDLGFEELGQMSHRIQERLYGKRDGDCGRKTNREGGARRALSPRRRSRSSSSSGSSFSPPARDDGATKDSYSPRRSVTAVHQSVEYVHRTSSSSSSLQDGEKGHANSQETSATLPAFSPSFSYSVSEPPPAPVMPPTYSPVNCSPLPYPPLSPALPPPLSPALPPVLPQVPPGIFLPRLPPFLPYPHVRPMNVFPAMLAQTRPHLLPQHITSPRLPPLFNLPDVNATQPLNATQKAKAVQRPRCLQVIETKQPG